MVTRNGGSASARIAGSSKRRCQAGFKPASQSAVKKPSATESSVPKQLTTGNFNHSGPSWAPDGKTIILSGTRKPDAEYLRGDSEIYSLRLDTLDITPLTDRSGPDSGPEVSPDGRLQST